MTDMYLYYLNPIYLMDKETIIEILSDWNFWKKEQETGIFRTEYIERMERFIQTGQILAMTGVRRSGKSTLMKQFIKHNIENSELPMSFLYVNFEEPKFAGMLSLEFVQKIYDAYMEIIKPEGTPYILFDEVQRVSGWERFVRGLHEKKEAHVIVSGSTSSLLSHEFGSVLTGRWIGLKVYPLTFREFLEFKGLELEKKIDVLSKKLKIKQMLREYLEFGGFPLIALKKEKTEILARYFDDILTKDIAERHKIRKTEKLKALGKYYITNSSSLISYRRVAKFIGLSLDTVERFSGYMKDAHLLYFVPKFSTSLKEQEVNPKKVYCIDGGLVSTVSFRFSDYIGKLYENIVFFSLLHSGKEIYYYKTRGECDFVVKEKEKITNLIQVSYQLLENKKREVTGLMEAMGALKIKKGLIITEDLEGSEKIKGKTIKYIPLWKWLLE